MFKKLKIDPFKIFKLNAYYKHAFNDTEEGRAILGDLLIVSKWREQLGVRSANELAYMQGQRDLINHILSHLNVNDDELAKYQENYQQQFLRDEHDE
ncbi:MAG: hypothetical protein AAF403_00590 [Pseudomonadota bacterium]